MIPGYLSAARHAGRLLARYHAIPVGAPGRWDAFARYARAMWDASQLRAAESLPGDHPSDFE